MKNILLTFICLILISGCIQEKTVKNENKLAFKGIELNSWHPASGQWHFSLLPGTNRRKTITEITDPRTQIVGVENLKKALRKFTIGENVFWVNYAKEPVPKNIIENLKKYSKRIKIKLEKL